MKHEALQSYLDGWLADTCNRYLNLVDEMGVIDRKKRAKKSDEILKARNALLDQWAPFYAKQLSALIDEAAVRSNSETELK